MNRSTRTSLLAAAATTATLLTLRPLVSSGAWFADALLVVVAVTGTGIAVHRLSRRHAPAVAAQALVLGALLVLLYAPGTALLGVVPTGETLRRLAALATDGALAVQRYSVPVSDLRGLQPLMVAGAGLLALAVDVLATRLRHPALAGLPLAATYAVPVALAPGGSGAFAFVLAALCYLLLLRADVSGRERRWVPAAARRAGVNGLGLAAAAVAVAVVVPAAVPDLDEKPLTFDLGQGESITVINPILHLKDSLGARSDATVLLYETTEDAPAPLRIVTADVFDGKTWAPRTGTDIPRIQRVQTGMPTAPGLSDEVRSAAVEETTSVTVRNLQQNYLPLPYPAVRVAIEGDWLYEQDTLNVVGDGETTLGRRYTVAHLRVTPKESTLREAPPAPEGIRDVYTALPETLPASVHEAARTVTEGARDDYERAVQLQRYFRTTGGFTYSTEVADDGGSDAVASFLDSRSGFCVQFASAMAVMARSLGIPARLAIGFLPGERVGDGRWRISAQDAHAWPELYFEGTGWVRFEPTPAARTPNAPPWSLPAVTPGTNGQVPPEAALQPSESPGAAPSAAPSTAAAEEELELGTGERAWSDPVEELPWAWFVIVALLLSSLLLPVLSDTVLRRRRWASVRGADDSAEAAWADLADRTRDLGAAWPDSATPRQAAERLGEFAELQPEESAALTRLRRAVERARFAPGADGGERLARADVDRIVAAVAAQQPRSVQWRARLWPSAGMRALSRTEVPVPWSRRGPDQAPGRGAEPAPRERERVGSSR
ncbi:transglutaminase superfamily protein [Kineococcus xinjiangensis]|uniref:Transglutaminase superfamily protein n=1 Tax=Kineococcus xinjiangensis TaxID=512762 RepID=A0A2S6ILY9_9ACTN|nr:DUF3488 and transglutaminase-like domain-containing protein [Kineococcus xinjiangensis]PPK95247.1 transglutaminase superfamily protein [Kineococcus xinjiangensis]